MLVLQMFVTNVINTLSSSKENVKKFAMMDTSPEIKHVTDVLKTVPDVTDLTVAPHVIMDTKFKMENVLVIVLLDITMTK
jgi:hypothetical protein